METKKQLFIGACIEQKCILSSDETTAENEMKPAYFITESTVFIEEKGHLCAYGIGFSDGKESNVLLITDVSTDKSLVEKIIKLLNDNKVSPEHFYYVLEDILP